MEELQAYRAARFGLHGEAAARDAALASTTTTTSAGADVEAKRVVCLLDVDCFFAQAEELRNPALRGKPLGVTQKYLVVTANYEARKRGVGKLQGIADALKACPEIALVSGEDLTPYRIASKAIKNVAARFGVVESGGRDEFFVDVTKEVDRRVRRGEVPVRWAGHVHAAAHGTRADNHHRPMDLTAENSGGAPAAASVSGPGTERLRVGSAVAAELRAAVRAETGFACSAGVSHSKLLAKLCAGLHKPDDQTALPAAEAAVFVASLPLRALPGVGHTLDKDLREQGLQTAADVLPIPRHKLVLRHGERVGAMLFDLVRGVDKAPVTDRGPPKSITKEDSFKPVTCFAAIRDVLRVLTPDLVAEVEDDGAETGRRPRLLTVKYRLSGMGYKRSSASAPWPQGRADPRAVEDAAFRLLQSKMPNEPFACSLINVGATNFTEPRPPNPASSVAVTGPMTWVQQALAHGEANAAAAADAARERRRGYDTTNSAPLFSKSAERALAESSRSPAAALYAKYDDVDEQSTGGDPEGEAAAAGASERTPKRQRLMTDTVSVRPPAQTRRRVVVHLDIDAFYCAVERIDDETLVGKPLAVSQFNSGGFVAVSYEAKAAGVKKGDGVGAGGRAHIARLREIGAVSLEDARRKCPGLVVRAMRTDRYREMSVAALRFLQRWGTVEKTSYDDYYIELVGLGDGGRPPDPEGSHALVKLVGDVPWDEVADDLRQGAMVGLTIKQGLERELGLPASVGVARNRLVARLLSPTVKPGGVALAPDGPATVSFVRSVPLIRVPSMQGESGRDIAETLKIERVGELERFPEHELVRRFGKAHGTFLRSLLDAHDETPVRERGPPASMIEQRSFQPVSDMTVATEWLAVLGGLLWPRLMEDAAEHRRAPKKLVVKWRAGYGTNERSTSGPFPSKLMTALRSPASAEAAAESAPHVLAEAAAQLLAKLLGGSFQVTRLVIGAEFDKGAARAAKGQVSLDRFVTVDESPTKLAPAEGTDEDDEDDEELCMGGWCSACASIVIDAATHRCQG